MFKWDEKYSVGFQIIDNQHKEIFRILNLLFESLKSGKTDLITDQIIPELERYANIHFQTEEHFFEKFNYSDADDHISEHEEFKLSLEEIKAGLKSGEISLSFELMIFLKNWINHHILEVDQKYAELFRQSGLK